MSEYIRTTRECSVTQLHPELLQAVRSYFREHRLGDPETETLICCETLSRRKSAGKLVSWLSGKSDATIYTGMLLTSGRLIWVNHGDQSGTLLNAADLKQIRAGFYRSPLTKDTGLEIVGYIGDDKNRIRGYVGMGADPAAQKFCEEVTQAINRVNPPAKKGLFRWLGG
ncbi:MAG: hypothetical protein JW730_02540 [Anaerolineales bacterium]|nr:hypothetical protein [Anaerolineales bacterium]